MEKGWHSQSAIFLTVYSDVLLSMNCDAVTADLDMCHRTISVTQRALVGHAIKLLEKKRLETCVAACEFEQKCFSINFFFTSKKCELNRKTAEWYPTDLLTSEDSVYLTIVSRSYTPCVDKQPPCLGTCIPIPGSLSTRCVCERNQTCGNNSCIPVPLGMENRSITSDQITASSTHSHSNKDWGRLNDPQGSWTPVDDYTYPWFQVNFDLKLITHIATQGNGIKFWYVTEYYVMYKVGGSPLQDYTEDGLRKAFQGNSNKDTAVKNQFSHAFKADTVRVVPTAFTGRIALRVEIYGCTVWQMIFP